MNLTTATICKSQPIIYNLDRNIPFEVGLTGGLGLNALSLVGIFKMLGKKDDDK